MKSRRRTMVRCLVLAMGLGPGAMVSFAPPVAADQPFVYATWQRAEGLPQDSVTTLFQDHHSYLWIGTQEGLARFDSREFTVFDRSLTPELASNWIYDLAGDDQGSLWIATRRGLSRFHRGRFELYTPQDGLPHRSVRVLHVDREQRLWIGTDGGLGLLDERRETFETVTGGTGLPGGAVLALCGGGETLWVGTESGLGRVRREAGGGWIAEAFGPAGDTVFALLEDRAGVLWIGTSAGLRRQAEGKVEDASYPELAGLAVRALLEDGDGVLWIGTEDGLFRLRGGVLTRDERWPNADVRSFLEDHEGGLWIGLWTGGLTRATRNGFSHFSEEEGLPGGVTWTVYEDRAGAVWIGGNGGLTRVAGGEVRIFPLSAPADARTDVTTLLEDRQGTLWAGTWEQGLARLREGRLELAAAGPSLLRITCLLEDRAGALWIGTDGRGLHRRTADGSMRAYTVSDGLPSNVVHDVYEDAAGDLWIATDGGMTRWVGGRLEPLSVPGAPHGTVVIAIYGEKEDNGGETLWLGTLGEGLLRFRDGTFARADRSDGLPGDKVYEILGDDLGHLWVSTPDLLLRVDERELNAYLDKRRGDFTVHAFNRSSGLWSDDFSGGNQPAGTRTSDGRLWFATEQGAVVVDPVNVRGPLPAPPVHIYKVLVDGEPLPTLHGQPVVQAGAKKIEFSYKVLDYSGTRDVRTRHILFGTDDDWAVGNGGGSFQYMSLEPGDHVFKVETAGGDGEWKPGHELTFVLQPTFRQTWYFYAVCVLGAVLLGGVVHRLLVRRLVSYNEDLRRMKRELEERNSELARFIYTLSHDIKNPLLTIRTFVGVVEQEAAQAGSPRMRADLHRIHDAAETLQEILDELLEVSRIGRVVNPPSELVLAELLEEVLGHFVDTFREERIEVVVQGEYPVVLGDRRRLFEVFQNLVENAVKFLGDAESPRIEIGTRKNGGEIVFYVRDNGIGIDPRYHERIFHLFHQLDPAAEGIGAGLATVRHIVELHGGRIWVESEGVGKGTTFAFTLPGLSGVGERPR